MMEVETSMGSVADFLEETDQRPKGHAQKPYVKRILP